MQKLLYSRKKTTEGQAIYTCTQLTFHVFALIHVLHLMESRQIGVAKMILKKETCKSIAFLNSNIFTVKFRNPVIEI